MLFYPDADQMFVGHTTIGIEFNICRVSSRACISIVWQQLLRICCGLPLVLLLTLSVHLAGSLHQCAPSTHLYGLPIRFTMLKRAKNKMEPFEGQPRKWKLVRRFPRLEVRYSSILNAGFGLFVAEDVKAGQPIATYRRKIVSEAMAKKLKRKVSNVYDPNVISY